MENNSENGLRRVLRIHVEPVEVDLDEDGTLLITALQAALPGAYGLYFREGDCKASLRFDGKKILPPRDGWKDRKVYATLGCRPFDYPFGSYANATKQFERSVNIVQRLLANSNFFGQDIITTRKSAATQRSVRNENMQQLLNSITQRHVVAASETNAIIEEEQTPLEQQFVELARISTAKDSIIEQQRADLKIANDKLEHKERSLKCMQDNVSKLVKSCSAKEEELAVLRNLKKSQAHDKVDELTRKLLDYENTITAQKKEIEFLVRKLARLDDEGELPQQSPKVDAFFEKTTESTIEPLEIQKSERTQDGQKDEEMTYAELMDALFRAKIQIEKLENELKVADEKYQQLNEVYLTVVAENTKLMNLTELKQEGGTNIVIKKESLENTESVAEEGDIWEAEKLKKELAGSEKRVAELTRMVHVLTKEASNSELRAVHAITTRNEMKHSLDHAEARIQELLQAECHECEFFRHDLHDAMKLIAELNALIADFSNDARNSRRDFTDLL